MSYETCYYICMQPSDDVTKSFLRDKDVKITSSFTEKLDLQHRKKFLERVEKIDGAYQALKEKKNHGI